MALGKELTLIKYPIQTYVCQTKQNLFCAVGKTGNSDKHKQPQGYLEKYCLEPTAYITHFMNPLLHRPNLSSLKPMPKFLPSYYSISLLQQPTFTTQKPIHIFTILSLNRNISTPLSSLSVGTDSQSQHKSLEHNWMFLYLGLVCQSYYIKTSPLERLDFLSLRIIF